MEGTVVDVGKGNLMVKVTAVPRAVESIRVIGEVELSLRTNADKMVRIDRLDEVAHFPNPSTDNSVVAVIGAREIANAVGATAGLVGKLPGHDGGGVLVAVDKDADIVLEGLLDLLAGVEVIVVSAATKQVNGVDIHSTIVGPV